MDPAVIENHLQYRITTAWAERFARSVEQLTDAPTGADLADPRMRQAQIDALRSQLADLRTELAEYDALRSGQRTVLHLDSSSALVKAGVKARIAAGLTQRDLAERLGLKPQQIPRYEATGYASVSLGRSGK